ncbi:MAG TPA: TadE/TadG family type IV pilus assembly protein [Candidatus Dormibacteraeota bacterium]|nr:TadE/TadG family type IV pilus assembly protein [Candidatus Dormibacteraeota bacterium]
MRRCRGQALVELALCAPVILVLALGAVAAVEVVQAQSGLQAATDAAASAAVRAPNAATADATAQSTFAGVGASYPLLAPALTITAGDFGRSSTLTADASASVDLGAEAMAVLPARLTLHAHAELTVEPWRSRP